MAYIGMDISSNRIAVAELEKTRKTFVITNAAVFEIPEQVIEKGEIKDTRVVSNAIRDIWEYYRFRSRKVLVGLSNPKVIIKEIKLPVTEPREIDSSIKYQINDLVPISKNNITYDYFIVSKDQDSSTVMIAGAAKNMVDSIVESLRNIRINPLAIDLNCFSLFRVINNAFNFAPLENSKQKDAYCLVNIGKDISIINMVIGDELKFPRFSNISIRTFVDSISKKTKKSYGEVEKLLDDFDFDHSMDMQFDRNIEPGIANKQDNMVKKNDNDISLNIAIKEASNQFINEINRSLDYFLNQYSAYNIKKIILSGDIFNNFDQLVNKETGYEVELFKVSDYFELGTLNKKSCYLNKDLKIISNQLTLAIGMALRGYGL